MMDSVDNVTADGNSWHDDADLGHEEGPRPASGRREYHALLSWDDLKHRKHPTETVNLNVGRSSSSLLVNPVEPYMVLVIREFIPSQVAVKETANVNLDVYVLDSFCSMSGTDGGNFSFHRHRPVWFNCNTLDSYFGDTRF
jgi:hypothetical protein